MMWRMDNLRMKPGDEDYAGAVSQKLNIPKRFLSDVTLLRRSVDARKARVHLNVSVAFAAEGYDSVLKKDKSVRPYTPYVYTWPPQSDRKVVVVGDGPAGMFCAYVLAKSGVDVTVVERGRKVEERVHDVNRLMHGAVLNSESNIAFGEGGAGTFSDGKLTTGTKNPRIRFVLDTYITHGAPKDIGYDALPHIGTDKLREVMANMRHTMEEDGVHFMFGTRFVDFTDHEVIVEQGGEETRLSCDDVVLALGHSARDTYETLAGHMSVVPKSFAVGVRLEQKQSLINQIQYKKDARNPHLGAAPFKLTARTSTGRGVYTFCMCPGGTVVPSTTQAGEIVVNGMSEHARDAENANSAILVQVTPEDYPEGPLGGLSFQKELEDKAWALGGGGFKAPVQRCIDYMEGRSTEALGDVRPSYLPGWTFADLNDIFPEDINQSLKEGLEHMGQVMPGLIDDNTLLTGVESRSSAPVRFVRGKDMCAEGYDWVYPIGEGAGYSGGIMSSAVDGILCAEKILEKGD